MMLTKLQKFTLIGLLAAILWQAERERYKGNDA
jgi:hypothetical protein